MNFELEEKRLLEIANIQNQDVQNSIDKLNSGSDFEFNARSYLRAYATWVEGSVWLIKGLFKKSECQFALPLECQLFLHEYDWDIKNSGQPYLKKKKIGTKDNIKALFYLANHLNNEFSVDFQSKEWQGVVLFYKLRDSMMHPKNLESMHFSSEQIAKCDKSRLWLYKKFSEILHVIVAES